MREGSTFRGEENIKTINRLQNGERGKRMERHLGGDWVKVTGVDEKRRRRTKVKLKGEKEDRLQLFTQVSRDLKLCRNRKLVGPIRSLGVRLHDGGRGKTSLPKT